MSDLSRHHNPTKDEDTALAPYNFVALPQAVVTVDTPPRQDVYDAERHTGHIDCVLTTETPLYTRAALEKQEYAAGLQGKSKADFFYVDPASQKPVIPGSSLRGMLRMLVEIAGFGKVQPVSDASIVYRAVGDVTSHGDRYRDRLMHSDGAGYQDGKRTLLYTPLMRAGYMEQENGEWQIHPAQKIGGTTFARVHNNVLYKLGRDLQAIEGCRNAAQLYIQPGPFDYQDVRGGFLRIRMSKVLRASATPGAGLILGTLTRSGPMASKRTEAVVFPRDKDEAPIPVSDDLLQSYREQISQEQRRLLGANGVLNPGQPVFYLIEEGNLIFFGHTMMMRLPYQQTPLDFVPTKLRDPDTTDLAEAIFGYVEEKAKNRKNAWAGRVFIGDAHVDGSVDKLWLDKEPIMPQILATPKPTTFQHYLVQQNPDPIQQGSTRDGRPKFKKELSDYATATDETAVRGHKLYWHKGLVDKSQIEEDRGKVQNLDDDTQHTHIRPVAAGVRFRFTIRFENLSDVELGALLWCLTLPGEEGKEYRHKLGMGKPLGMGAAHLEPTLVLDHRKERYQTLFDSDGWKVSASGDLSFDPYLNAFRSGILAQRDAIRIRMLLKLLEWPGPARGQTRYLEIERPDPTRSRGKINEYKERPVLPTPLADMPTGNAQNDDVLLDATPSTPQQTVYRSEMSSVSEQAAAALAAQVMAALGGDDAAVLEEPNTTATPQAETMHNAIVPTEKDQVQPGVYVQGTVDRVDQNRVVVTILDEEATLLFEQIHPSLRDQYEAEERFPSGRMIKAWVRRVNKRGRIQLTMERPKS